MTVGGAKLVVAMSESKIFAVTLADGNQAWQTPFAAMGMGGYNGWSGICYHRLHGGNIHS